MTLFYSIGDLAKKTFLSPPGVRAAIARREIEVSAITRGGIRLISIEEAQRFAESRRGKDRRDE